MDIEVRKAGAGDAEAFVSLVAALAEYEHLEPPDRERTNRLIRDAFTLKRFSVLMAFKGERAVGYAAYFMTYSTFLAAPTLYLEDLFVLHEYRRKGVGLLMMHRLAREALELGCERMEWIVLDWNTTAMSFYERLGAKVLHEWKHFRMDRDDMERLADETVSQ